MSISVRRNEEEEEPREVLIFKKGDRFERTETGRDLQKPLPFVKYLLKFPLNKQNKYLRIQILNPGIFEKLLVKEKQKTKSVVPLT